MEWSERNGGVWVFGYGSLVWNPGFEYKRSLIGFIKGYERRFWQGNATHRGTPENPGRVATLVENKQAITWGRAFLLTPESASSSLNYLQQRETNLGGYITTIVDFQPRDPKEGPGNGGHFPTLLYTATERNPFYLGPNSIPKLAEQISKTSGSCGTNSEYVLKLAEFMRIEVPGVWDDHLYSLEKELKRRMMDEDLDRTTGNLEKELQYGAEHGFDYKKDEGHRMESENIAARGAGASSSAYSSQVKSRKLKCVNIL